MPIQTSFQGYEFFPDGCQVLIKASGDSSYTDLGVINSAVTGSLEYSENTITTANAGRSDKQIRDMIVTGSFTLVSQNPANLQKLGGGMFTYESTAAAAVTTIPDQTIASGWVDGQLYDLVLQTSSSNTTELKMSSAPTITSVTLNAGSPEVLVADTEYKIVPNSNSNSGYSILFIESGMATGTPTNYTITIDYGSNTPIARESLFAGASTEILTEFAMKWLHTDENSLTRGIEFYNVDTNSGGFNFSMKGANEDGYEEMEISFTAKVVAGTGKASGKQLFEQFIDASAQ